jgi:hypothetical protein
VKGRTIGVCAQACRGVLQARGKGEKHQVKGGHSSRQQAKARKGAQKRGTNPKGTPKPSSSGVGYCIRFLCVISLLLYLLEIFIIKFLFYWFSHGGFSRVMLTKNICV